MRLTRQGRPTEKAQSNMASMIDVVFLLLIFFMCTSSLVRPEKALPSRLPKSGQSAEGAQALLDPVRIDLSLTKEGRVSMTCDELPCATVRDLVAMLGARGALGDPPVIIAGGANVPFGSMVAALDACHLAGLTRVAFSAEGTE